jgi:hypothetical protein
MSQEEIESLMNGLDLAEDSASEVAAEGEEAASEPVSEPEAVNDVSDPVSEPSAEPEAASDALEPEEAASEDISDEKDAPVDEILANLEQTDSSSEEVSNDSIDDLIDNLDLPEDTTNEVESEVAEDATVSTDDIDELLASIDAPAEENTTDASEIDDLLAGLDDVEEEVMASVEEDIAEPEVKETTPDPVVEAPIPETVAEKVPEEVVDDMEDKINKGVFPLPAEPESKVVSQLSAVANDSEEKATKIFDVLSFILDENYNIESSAKKLDEFLIEQEKVLQTLTAKFPNVDVFSTNLEMLKGLKEEPQKIKDIVNNENNELFSAMELMQYHDINRQKIERVMSVIRKLTIYLNNIFEDDNSHEEIAVAKHISGDSTEDLVADEDLDALIAEFGN